MVGSFQSLLQPVKHLQFLFKGIAGFLIRSKILVIENGARGMAKSYDCVLTKNKLI